MTSATGGRGAVRRGLGPLGALALCLAHCAPASATAQSVPGQTHPRLAGLVVLQDRAFEFDEHACARILRTPAEGERLCITLRGDALSQVDPFARAGSACARVELDPSTAYPDDGRELAARVRAAACVSLAGGKYMTWYALLTPGGAPSRLGSALHEAHRAGSVVAGHGAAAAFLARWTLVDRAALQRERRNPRRSDPDVVLEGLGLVPDLMVDTSARTQGSLAGLFDALLRGSQGLGVYLAGEAAWVYDGVQHTAWVEGGGFALVFDASSARMQRDALRAGRVSLLGSGDRFDDRTRAVASADRSFGRNTDVDAEPDRVSAALGVGDLRQALSRLGSPAATRPFELGGETHRLTLWIDDHSRLGPAADGEQPTRAAIAFDLVRVRD